MALKYKVGDRVRIKDIDWYNENKDEYGNIDINHDFTFYADRRKYCGKVVTISEVFDIGYSVKEDNDEYYWTDEMFEGLVEEETKPKFKVGDRVIVRDTVGIWEITNVEDDILYTIKREDHTFTLTTYGSFLTLYEGITDKKEEMKSEDELLDNYEELTDRAFKGGYEKCKSDIELNGFQLPEGYQFVDENGNIINTQKIILEKKPDDKLKLESTKKVREYWSEYTRIFIEIYDDEPNECILTHLYTLEGHRQKGYGRQALIEAESIAKELGCHTAYLKVETNSWMHEWYLRMGYKWYKTVDKEYIWLVKNFTGMEKKKKEYPKTYEECYKIMGVKLSDCYIQGYKSPLLEDLQELLICRDAYWKIAGEEMGLNGPWKPDWEDGNLKWCMSYSGNYIEFDQYKSKHHTLAFPTAEMRDAFYENFKELIESVKELL